MRHFPGYIGAMAQHGVAHWKAEVASDRAIT
jgi:hypothetical protein